MSILKLFHFNTLIVLIKATSQPIMLVNTVLQEPFIMKASDAESDSRFGYKGILIDMLVSFLESDKSEANVKFNVFQEYGRKENNGTWTGLVGGMINNSEAAFGLTDLTINSERLEVVQFSLPVLSTSGLSAIGKGLNFTINQENLPRLLKMSQDDKITIGCLKGDAIEHVFKDTDIPIYRKLYDQMKKHNENFVKTTEEGFAKARKAPADKPYVYIDEKAYLDYYAGKEPCDLRLTTCETFNTAHYAMVFSNIKSQSLINHYNKLIADYLSSGKMEISIKKWYKNECNNEKTAS